MPVLVTCSSWAEAAADAADVGPGAADVVAELPGVLLLLHAVAIKAMPKPDEQAAIQRRRRWLTPRGSAAPGPPELVLLVHDLMRMVSSAASASFGGNTHSKGGQFIAVPARWNTSRGRGRATGARAVVGASFRSE
jgi:hypothetical protein